MPHAIGRMGSADARDFDVNVRASVRYDPLLARLLNVCDSHRFSTRRTIPHRL